jgi:SAM-dependent methyltransferase
MANHEAGDQARAEAFAGRVLADTTGFAVTLMAAMGDRLELFKHVAAGPVTSAELAGRAGINERYAREWLACMARAHYLEYEPGSERFRMPPEHVPALAEEGGPLFFGGTHQMLLGMLEPLDLLEQAFRVGGGVPMSAYGPDTWDGMERDMAGIYESKLLRQWIPAMPDVRSMLESGVQVADIGCGRGRVLVILAKAFPESRYVGYDVFAPNVAAATARAEAAGVGDRVRFQAVDGASDLPEQFDLITTFDVVHDAADPPGLLSVIRRALRAGGRYVCMDVNCADKLEDNTGPMDTLRYGVSLLYCMTTSLGNGGAGLGAMGLPASKMRELCLAAAFSSFRQVPLENSLHNLYEAATRD